MHPMMRYWLFSACIALLFTPAQTAAQVQAPPGEQPCQTQPDDQEAVAAWVQQFLSDPAFADGRAYYSLAALAPSTPATVWTASNSACRTLVSDAVDAINDFYGTSLARQRLEYITIAIGPYLAVYDAGWTGDARPIVIFNASDGSLAALIHSGF